MGGVTAVAAAAGTAGAKPAAAPAPGKTAPKGYRVTPHVAKYYDKARF
jgi:hypothetical protein